MAGPEAELTSTQALETVAAVPQPVVSRLRDPSAAQKARDFIQGLGGAKNIKQVETVAEARLRVVVADEAQVDESGLQTSGVDAVMRLPNQILHLIVGLNADQYAAEMRGHLAAP